MDGFYTAPPPELPGNIFSHFLNRTQSDRITVCTASVSLGEIVNTVADVFQRTLELSALPEQDCHFFLAGGDSLLATRLLSELNAAFPAKTVRSLTELLGNPTVGELASHIGEQLALAHKTHVF